VERIRAAAADVMVVANWRTWLPPAVFCLPRLGTLNVHDALLPAYAGFGPLNWALINGEPAVGVTAHMMDGDFGAGDIVLQRATPVGDEDTILELFDRTPAMFGPITVDALELLVSGRTDWRRSTAAERATSTGAARRTTGPTGAGLPGTSPTWCTRRSTGRHPASRPLSVHETPAPDIRAVPTGASVAHRVLGSREPRP
jgi:methionyl-tRNA formyltransferase